MKATSASIQTEMSDNLKLNICNNTTICNYSTNDQNQLDGVELNGMFYVLLGFSIIIVILLTIMWRKYHTLILKIQELQGLKDLLDRAPPSNTQAKSPLTVSDILTCDSRSPPPLEPLSVTLRLESQDISLATRLETKWRHPQMDSSFNRASVCLQQLIKSGHNGMYYKAKMTPGTCKGHFIVTCKITKEGVSHRRVAKEVSILRKLGTHKNVLQLLDWDITKAPYMLILESVNSGTLRSFLQVNQDQLSKDSELPHLLTTAAYHIAHAMRHLCSKMVVHGDLAVRNIMVNHFPREVKVAEFGLAQDLTRTRNRCRSHRGSNKENMPLRWYPPEYFRNHYYSFKGDVWAFGIMLWEMQTFGTLPYPNLEAPELVVHHVCSGYRNSVPETCRPEILQLINDCWLETHAQRPTFNDIVRVLENMLESDADYVKVEP